MNKAKTPFNLR